MLRWAGASLVVLSSALISMNAVIRTWQRVRALRVLLDALQAMESELAERRTLLPELMERLASGQKPEKLFTDITLNLRQIASTSRESVLSSPTG